MLRLFGTHTSPYVRRVRVVAHELGLACELVDTAEDAGQAELRARSPIWKVPSAELDGELVFDSGVICARLLAAHGRGQLVGTEALADRNALTVIDGALDSLINCFYLARDGVDVAAVPYLSKQQARAASAMAWLDARVEDGWISSGRSFGLAEIALGTTAAWMRFRGTYELDGHPGVRACLERCEARASFVATRPPG